MQDNKGAEEVERLEAEQEIQAESQEENKEQDSFKDKYYYLAAEMQNVQKRYEREKSNYIKFAGEQVLKDMLQVMDNFDLTAKAIQSDADPKIKNIYIGIDMVRKQFLDVLAKHGLTKIDCLGKMFDPNFHEAVAQEVKEGKKEMEIITEHQSGYLLSGRLLRASKVVVVKN